MDDESPNGLTTWLAVFSDETVHIFILIFHIDSVQEGPSYHYWDSDFLTSTSTCPPTNILEGFVVLFLFPVEKEKED